MLRKVLIAVLKYNCIVVVHLTERDGPVNFKSEKSHKLKDLIKDIAIKGKWTSVTTLDGVRSSINAHAKGFDRDGLLILLNGG